MSLLSDRRLQSDDFDGADVGSGSEPRVRAEEKRSLARRGPPRASPTSVEPRTAAIRAAAGRQGQRLLGASQREYARQWAASAHAALLTSTASA